MVVDEIDRIWKMTEAYRTVHLYDSGARRRVVREHRSMIAALRRGDNAAVVELGLAIRGRGITVSTGAQVAGEASARARRPARSPGVR
jgi:DNA-binding GntR family transcriptional regulator